MADPAEFSPDELDHLEDALEGLEFAPASRDSAPHVRRRLDDYRNILALSRAAMPMVEVPKGLLDGVLAQARASAEVPSITPTVAAAAERPGFWARLRRFGLLPGVALAGTAAVVLLMVERKPELEAAGVATPAAAEAKADQAPARAGNRKAEVEAEAAATPVAAPAVRAQLAAPTQGAASSEPAGAMPGGMPATPPASAPPVPEPAPSDDANADEEFAEKKKEVAKPTDAGDVTADNKVADADTPRWDIIARGDRARHRGDCGVARNEYALALDDVDARVRARAHAGLGLCEAARGDRSSADAAYKAARELDGEIVAFIDDERPRAGAGTSQAKAKPKAATKAKADPVPQQVDAFE